MADLARQFTALTPPAGAKSDLRFSATPVDGHLSHRVAVDRHGLPALLIGVSDSAVAGPPMVLEHMRMQQGVDCRITEQNGTTGTHRFTIIRCTDWDPVTHEYFLRVGETVLDALGDNPRSQDVTKAIERLVQLFRALTAPPRRSVIGFWAEMFVISQARDPVPLVRAWHERPEERFDFAWLDERLEVKAASGRVRRHHFSLEQLLPVSQTRVLIASLLVERSPGGPSVGELVDATRRAVAGDAEQLFHVDEVVALTLGGTWQAAMHERFDGSLAAQSLAFFEQGAIPRPPGAMPTGVTEVKFASELSACPPAALNAYSARPGLLAAAIARRPRQRRSGRR